jgi:hypothetical protein
MFDDIAKTYMTTFGHDPNLHRVISEALNRIEPDSRILDVGCSIWRLIAFYIVADRAVYLSMCGTCLPNLLLLS